MNIRQLLFAFTLSILALSGASAASWTGTITETITESNSTDFLVGQSFIGNYSYEADSRDGDFGNLMCRLGVPGSTDAPIAGELFLFNMGTQPIYTGGLNYDTHLTVADGEVTAFYALSRNIRTR